MKLMNVLFRTFLMMAIVFPALSSDDRNDEGKRPRFTVSKNNPSKPTSVKKSKKETRAKPVAVAVFIKEKYKQAPLKKGQMEPCFFNAEATFLLGRVPLNPKNQKGLVDLISQGTFITLTKKNLKLFEEIAYSLPSREIPLEAGKPISVIAVFKGDKEEALYERFDSSGLLPYREVVK